MLATELWPKHSCHLLWPPQGGMRRCWSLFPLSSLTQVHWPGLILGILEVPEPIIKSSRLQKIVFDIVVQFSLRRGAVNALMFTGNYMALKFLHTYASTVLQSRFKYYFYICFKHQQVCAASSEEPNLCKLWSKICKCIAVRERFAIMHRSFLPASLT